MCVCASFPEEETRAAAASVSVAWVAGGALRDVWCFLRSVADTRVRVLGLLFALHASRLLRLGSVGDAASII